MESACESGKITANIILQKYKKKQAFLYKHNKPIYFSLFNNIDNILFDNQLPSIFIVFFIIILLFIIWYFINNKNMVFYQ